jgi:hypothetical protein
MISGCRSQILELKSLSSKVDTIQSKQRRRELRMAFLKENKEKYRDAGEPGLSSWTIKLSKPDKTTITTTTDTNGNYKFNSLLPETYTVSEVLKGNWKQTNPAASGKNFGNKPVPLKILVPLYVDPDSNWDRIVKAASCVSITVIINPNDGPGGNPTVEYLAGIKKLHNAGVKVVGYVYTGYGARNPKYIRADVDLYKRFGIDGIFFDEVSDESKDLGYYKLLSDYVRSNYRIGAVFLNPGTKTDEEYIKNSIGDTTVIFEDSWTKWPGYQPDKYISKYGHDRFASLVYTTSDASAMRSSIDLALNRGIGYVFVTDQKEPNPWSKLPAFWDAEVDYAAI